MATPQIDVDDVLAGIPKGLRIPLLKSYNSICKNFREERWEPAELNGGKLCEIVYTILRGHVDGKFPATPKKPKNMHDDCKALEQADSNKFGHSVRVHIPRLLITLYTIRNQRGVGHVGGDVDANHMDSVFVLYSAKWIMAELVRLFHQVDTATATGIVEALVERAVPLIWEVGENKRVLDPKMSMKDKMLVLLYSCAEPVSEADLFRWVEHTQHEFPARCRCQSA